MMMMMIDRVVQTPPQLRVVASIHPSIHPRLSCHQPKQEADRRYPPTPLLALHCAFQPTNRPTNQPTNHRQQQQVFSADVPLGRRAPTGTGTPPTVHCPAGDHPQLRPFRTCGGAHIPGAKQSSTKKEEQHRSIGVRLFVRASSVSGWTPIHCQNKQTIAFRFAKHESLCLLPAPQTHHGRHTWKSASTCSTTPSSPSKR